MADRLLTKLSTVYYISMRLMCLIFTLLLVISCKSNNNEIELIKENDSIKEVYMADNKVTNDSVCLSLKLENKIYNVQALVDGTIVNSEVDLQTPQKIDSIKLIIAIDNRPAFIKLRQSKIELINALRSSKNGGNVTIQADVDKLLKLIKNDNLLPEINSTEFAIDFIDWLKRNNIYILYERAKSIESDMKNYFYINEQPIFLNNLYVKLGKEIKKGDMLYDYLLENKLIYTSKITILKENIFKLYDADSNKEILNFEIKEGKIRIVELLKSKVEKDKRIVVVLKKQVS